ncbi:MAG TPA: efflux RND transporter periplasmic adaptor subunit [Candidatus Acidoferrum sp.]|nr:efflux RND transporter periplasmic adaptor subunit [Candidatus Acidoferrum sp.]
MTKSMSLLLLLAMVGAGVFIAGCSKGDNGGGAAAAQETKTLYTCGMHPQVVQDHPGNCPICGMKLTPIRKQTGVENANSNTRGQPGERKIKYYKSTMMPGEVRQTPGKDSMGMDMVPVYEDQAAASQSQTIAIDPVTMQNMGIRTAVATRGPLRRTIRTVGVVAYNEATLADVTTKFKGWIEKLYVNTTGQLVMRGDPLFEIYSPDLYSAQVEYLLATDPSNPASGRDPLKTSALTKLQFFDISAGQIAELERTRQARKTLRMDAPQDGFVVEKNVVEGQMVDAGMRTYRLADLGLVWVQAQIYEQDLAYLKLGEEATVTLDYLPDREFRGRVTYIYPNVDEKTRTAQVRMEFHNPGYFLKPGMFATVKVVSELEPSALLIPDMAILRSGEKTTVFVALDGGKFDPRNVTLGPQAENDQYEVLSGVSEGERIVTSGQFMLDSESQLREAIQKMMEPQETAARAERESVRAAATLNASHASSEAVKYVCPMPEHISIEYDRPGKCSICGMTLVPVSEAMLKKLQPGGRILYYTCPMPEHSDVRSDKPGNCPKCGMTLIPVMEAPPLTPGGGAPTNRPSPPPAPAEGMSLPAHKD